MDGAADVALHWDRGALEIECDRSAQVQAGVESYLGRSPFSKDASTAVRVRLSHVAERGRARVLATVSQEDATGKVWGERSVSAESCQELDESLTLVVAMMVDARAAPPPETAAPPAAEPVPESPTATHATGEILTAPSLERAVQAPAHSAFMALSWVSMGALPETALGVSVLGSFKPRGFWGVGVELGALAPRRQALGEGSLEMSLLFARGSLCPLQGSDTRTWWSACANLGAGRVQARSRDLLEAQTRADWILLPSFSVRAAWRPMPSLLLGAGLDAAAPALQHRYVYRDPEGIQQLAFEMNRVVLSVNVGAGLFLD
jgi:hypothetical protein